jgi:pilus assembly protein TadC
MVLRKGISIIILTILFSILITELGSSQETVNDTDPPQAFLTNPLANNKTSQVMPLIIIQLDDQSEIDIGNIYLEIDGFDVSDWEETAINQTAITHAVPELFKMKEGNHTVNLTIRDEHGNCKDYSWTFIVDKSYGKEEEEIDYFRIFIVAIMIILLITIISTISFAIYLKVAKSFNFIKFYKRHPIDGEKAFLYLPMAIGILVIAGGLLYWMQYDVDADYFLEYIGLGGFFVFITAFTIHAQMEKRNTTSYEHAFSQLLFELADAMRGGIDPAKAIVELSGTNTGVLSKQLKIGAKNIKAGRPFEEVLSTIAKPTKSAIIMRYATLIGEASKVGGEIAQVVHRSAKDMDDMLKVKAEKRRQLVIQIFTIYIAFAVLTAIMWMLIGLYPKLSEMDFSLITNFNLAAATEDDSEANKVVRMSVVELKRNFFHLILFNSLGSGLLIGKLIDGKMKYGLIHSLILMGAASLIFFFMIL